MQVLIGFKKDQRDTVIAALEELGFIQLAGTEVGVGDNCRVSGVIPDGVHDSIRNIEGVVMHEASDDDLDQL